MKLFFLPRTFLTVILVISMCILPMFTFFAQAKETNGSYAYYYGDINENGDIDKLDYIIIKRHCMNTIMLNSEQLLRGDVNGSGDIDIFDYILVKRHVMSTYIIPMVEIVCDHNYIPVVTPPTETEKGYTTHTCDKCGDSYVDSYVSPLGDFSEGLAYKVNDDGVTCTITGIGDCEDEDLNIPPVINGYLVTEIGRNAFHFGYITSVIIPEGVHTIGNYAFAECPVTSITIPDSVKTFGMRILQYSVAMENVYFQGDIEAWLSIDFYDHASNPCYSGANLYFNNILVEDVVIPDGTTKIGNYAFNGCYNITSISIPDSVTEIGNRAFEGCSSLTSITIPDSVTSIGEWAFYDCAGLESINLGNGITTISYATFFDCSSLTSITIPDSVTSIGNSAFYECPRLTDVYFTGTEEDWTNILIGGSNEYFTNATVHYNYGKPSYSVGLDYTVNPDGVTCTIIGIGDCEDTDLIIPSKIDGYKVTAIGNYAFIMCDRLTSVAIPDSVTSIGEQAFYCCVGLTSMTIPDSVVSIGARAFDDCIGLTNVTIGNGVTTIGNDAFFNCNRLTNLNIGNSVTSIGDYAFFNCHNLTSITIPDSVVTIGEGAFQNCINLASVNIPNSVTSIGYEAFYSCYSLSSITIGSGVTTFGPSAFGNCTELKSVTILDGVTSIGDNAFIGCSALTSVTIPDSVTEIGYYSFCDCYNLNDVYYQGEVKDWLSIEFDTEDANPCYYGANLYFNDVLVTDVIIPDGVAFIGNYAFGCTALTSVTIPVSVTEIGWDAFNGCDSLTDVYYMGSEEDWADVYISNGNEYLTNATIHYNYGKPSYSEGFEYSVLSDGISCMIMSIGTCTDTDIVIPEVIDGYKVTAIGNWAFSGNTEIKSVVIPDSVTDIYSSAFYECSLQSVVLPKGITYIDEKTFYFCTNLTSVTIPDSVKTIGKEAFYGCSNLKELVFGNSVESIGASAFAYCSALTSVDIPNSVTVIEDGAFSHCYALTSATMPNVTSIGSNAFDSCTALNEVVLGSSVKTIGDNAFYYCTALTSVTIPDSVTTIEHDAFASCYRLKTVTLGKGLTTLGSHAFSGCSALTSIIIPEGVTKIDSGTFFQCKALNEIVFGNNITRIESNAFYECEALTSITIPDSVTYIGKTAFYCCYGLKEIVFGSSVNRIDKEAFSHCNIISVTLPKSLAIIEAYAFDWCTDIKDVYYEGSDAEWNSITIVTVGNSFLINATIHYNYKPESSVMTYEEFLAAEVGSTVCVETYVQGNQSWWNETIVLYCQSKDGGYYVYNVACSEEDAAKLVKGRKIRVTGTKTEWAGVDEISEGTFEFVDDGETFIAEPTDVTDKLGSDGLIDYMNQYVTFKGLTVQSVEFKNGEPGNDIYLTFTKDGAVLEAMIEIYLTESDTEVYQTVCALKQGDVVDVIGFLNWYNGANPHITEITIINN